MIDIEAVKFEDSYFDSDKDLVCYLTCPLYFRESLFEEAESYGDVRFMSIRITFFDFDDGLSTIIEMSPTIYDGIGYTDEDWKPLKLGVDYDTDILFKLIYMALKGHYENDT